MPEWKCRSYRSGMRACSYFEVKRCGVSSLQLKILLDTQTHTTAPIVQQNRSDCIGVHSVKSCFSLSPSPFCSHRINLFYVARRQTQRRGGEEERRERLRRRTCGRGIIMPALFWVIYSWATDLLQLVNILAVYPDVYVPHIYEAEEKDHDVRIDCVCVCV